jgi:hypothetical protein
MANLWWYGVWPVVIRESKYLKRHEYFHTPPPPGSYTNKAMTIGFGTEKTFPEALLGRPGPDNSAVPSYARLAT